MSVTSARRASAPAVAPGARPLDDCLGHLAPRAVLNPENGREVDQLPRLLQLGEDEVLFQLLVVPLDETADDVGGARDRVEHRCVAGLQPPRSLLVDQKDPAQHPVLAHQILGGGDVARAGLGFGRARPERCPARPRHARQELPPPRTVLVHPPNIGMPARGANFAPGQAVAGPSAIDITFARPDRSRGGTHP